MRAQAGLQVKLDRVELQTGARDPARQRPCHLPMSFLPECVYLCDDKEDMMFKVEPSALEQYFAADPGGDAGLRAVERRAGTAVPRPAGTVGDCTIRTGERGAR